MKKHTFRLALSGLVIVIGFACFFSPAVASADASASSGPTLEGAQVSPENGPWGSIFTYEVIYADNENNMPAVGYPKVYIDGNPENMVGKDPTDNDVTDGKVYKYDWTTVKEDVGSHIFYYYVEMHTGENAATGTDNGPLVENRPVSLSCEVDKPEPAAGEILTFDGYLRTTEENLGVAGGSITLYKLLLDNDVSVGPSTTDENGYFALQLDAPSSAIFCYRARFPGDNYYAASESSILYVNTINKLWVFGLYAVILLALVGAMMSLFSRGIARARYLIPVVLGFLVGFFLIFIGAGFLGILAAGGIAGYLLAKATQEWTKHLRIGCMTGFLFLLVMELVIAFFLTWDPGVLGLDYSVTQMEVFGILFSETISSVMYYVLLAGVGAMMGGMLRKLLKPAGPWSATVGRSGYSRSERVNSRGDLKFR